MDSRRQVENIKKVYKEPKGSKDFRIQYVQEHVSKDNIRAVIRFLGGLFQIGLTFLCFYLMRLQHQKLLTKYGLGQK